jgi:hypothetical protein
MRYDNPSLHVALGLLWPFSAAITLLCVTALALKYRTLRQYVRQEVIILELTPPPSPHNTLQATEEFFSVLSKLVSLRSWRELVSGKHTTIALEVVSTRHQGIRYLVRLPRHDKPVFLHNLAAFAPTVTAVEATDYLEFDGDDQVSRLLELKQTGPRHYALKHDHAGSTNDPIAYITNAIGNLEDGELIAMQVVMSPSTDWHITHEKTAQADAVPGDIVAATTHKKHQPQIHSSIRILIRSLSDERLEQRTKGIRSALSAYSYEGYQSLTPRIDVLSAIRRYRLFAFENRLPALYGRNACLLASSELAALYHFPYGTASQTQDLQVGRPVALPVPLSIKGQGNVDLLLGDNHYRGRKTPIGLTEAERQRHIYVVGGTGNGKSTLLKYAFVQDMKAGKGVAILDPHGDLADDLLGYVPEERIDDVIYFNPSDLRHPIGLNLLELTSGLTGDELLHEKDIVTESIVSMFRKIFSSGDASGHRIEYVLRNAVQTALTLENPTLFTVYDLLNDAEYRKKMTKHLDNKDLKLFWTEFNRAGSYQQVSMAAGITAKIGRFLFSATARRILEQPTSSINFDKLMDEGKILICNVSKGQLGEDTSELFGIMLLAKLQLAALRRASQPIKERRPFYVYVDEFQNFATPSFVQLLSEARKYGLFLTMAEQSTSQQSDRRMIDIVFANVGTVIAFRTSSEQDEQLLQPLLSPFVEPGTLRHLPAYTFLVRIAAVISQQPFSCQTVLMDGPGDDMLAKIVVQASRMKYGRRQLELPVPEPEEVIEQVDKAIEDEAVFELAEAGAL